MLCGLFSFSMFLIMLSLGKGLVLPTKLLRPRSSSETKVVRRNLKFLATYIELVPPLEKNRLAPQFQPPPERFKSDEWLNTMISIYRSVTLRRIAPQLGITVLFTICLTCISYWTPFVPVITDFNIWFLMGSVLSLLLVFRTNSAYDRFWEARRQLGNLMQISRSLARIAAYTAPDSETKERIRLLLTAFPRLLISHLEGDFTLHPEIAAVVGLRNIDTRLVLASRNRPFRCAQIIGDVMNENLGMPSMSTERQMTGTLVGEMIDVIGNCERIVGCPVPLAYSRHTSRFLSFFTLTIPLVLIPNLGWNTIGMHALSSWAMYGIDEIGHVIENPFDSSVSQDLLDITRIHSSIESDVQDALAYVYLSNRPEPKEEEEEEVRGQEPAVSEATESGRIDSSRPPPFVG